MISLVIISFLLDGIFFSSLNSNTLFCPLFSILSILIIYPMLISDNNKYYIICGILGILYDICYANTLFLHFFIFIGFGIFVSFLFRKVSVNVLNTYLIGISGIVLYRLFHALFFVGLFFSNWSLNLLLKSIFSSIIINSIYLLCFYFIAKKIRINLRKKKYKLLKVQKSE